MRHAHRHALPFTLRLTLLLVLAAPVAAFAQSNTDPSIETFSTRGLFLHAHLGAYGVSFEDADDDGRGLGLRAGYGVSDLVTLYLGFEGTALDGQSDLDGLRTADEHAMVYLELGSRFLFRPGRQLIPFADLALSVVGIGNDDLVYGGAGISLGGGVLYFLTSRLAVQGGLAVTPGRFIEREAGGVAEDVDIHLIGTRLHVGVTLYPFRR